jgi:hypothetical protein
MCDLGVLSTILDFALGWLIVSAFGYMYVEYFYQGGIGTKGPRKVKGGFIKRLWPSSEGVRAVLSESENQGYSKYIAAHRVWYWATFIPCMFVVPVLVTLLNWGC